MAETMTEQQRKWFASVRNNLTRDTGKSLEEWVEIARTCPHDKHRARLQWFKETHGLMQNRASMVLSEAFPSTMTWDQPEAMREQLWADSTARMILAEVEAVTLNLDGVVVGQRKGYTAWSNRYQFAALKPLKSGGARLGLAVAPDRDGRLQPSRNDGWSERLLARIDLAAPSEFDGEIVAIIREAWSAS